MKLPNGYGTVYKLSGNRRKPYIARKSQVIDGVQVYKTIGYYATKKEGLQALSDVVPTTKKEKTIVEKVKRSFVYFISDGNCIKIGKANDVEKRMKSLQTGSSKKLNLLCKIPFDSASNAIKAETYFHNLFSFKKEINEWFNISPDDVFREIQRAGLYGG